MASTARWRAFCVCFSRARQRAMFQRLSVSVLPHIELVLVFQPGEWHESDHKPSRLYPAGYHKAGNELGLSPPWARRYSTAAVGWPFSYTATSLVWDCSANEAVTKVKGAAAPSRSVSVPVSFSSPPLFLSLAVPLLGPATLKSL